MSAALVDRWRATLLQQLAHDVKTPLSGVLGLSELVSITAADAQARRYGKLIHESGTRLQGLVEGVLELGQASATMAPDPRPLDLKRFVQCVAACHADTAHRHRAELVVEYDPALPQQLVADAPRLAFVLHAVVRHAVVHAEAATLVRLQARSSGEGVLFLVSAERASVADAAAREWERPCAELLAPIGGRFGPSSPSGRAHEFWVPVQRSGSGGERPLAAPG